ncbi:MAG: hypothetical protein A07HR67_02086 [uncultured archaeon A07HR67]|nr:MAG: hypothetical protein A07HR67_02086 [uncultured archaeon A07HR67]
MVGVLGATLVGAAYVVGSSALGGCLADEFGSERTGRENAATDATAAAKSPIERLKRRYVDASILVRSSVFRQSTVAGGD